MVWRAMMARVPASSRSVRPFNSPLECGLRMLFMLNAANGQPADLQRLISYDYPLASG